MLPLAKLQALIVRRDLVEAELSAGVEGERYVALSREFSELTPVVEAINAYRTAQAELADVEQLLADPATDREMADLAHEEKPALEEKLAALEHQLRLALLPKDAADAKNAILEIRAGTGGDEASLFAGDLFRMYERYAALQGWTVELISASEGTVGGYKEIVAEIRGAGAYARLKF